VRLPEYQKGILRTLNPNDLVTLARPVFYALQVQSCLTPRNLPLSRINTPVTLTLNKHQRGLVSAAL
jgi:hypothetical protein